MAIRILKHGKRTFKAKCDVCGCEFTYQSDDLREDTFKNHFVECPDCKEPILHIYEPKKKGIGSQKDGLSEDAWDILHSTFEPDLLKRKVPTQVDDTLNPWDMFQADSCEKCPYYKRILDGDCVGDSPCNWCQKRQAYCSNVVADAFVGDTETHG